MGVPDTSTFAESIRQATIRAAIDAYEDAGLQGLCEEGRWEVAVGAMRALDLTRLTRALEESRDSADPTHQG